MYDERRLAVGVGADAVATRRRRWRSNTGSVTDGGQESLERRGRGAADSGGPRPPRDGHDAVPQENAVGQLHGSGYIAVDAVGRQYAVGIRCGHQFESQ